MKRYQPLVSVIIPTHNEEHDIRATLDALLRLTYHRKEIILVDDASSDRTPEILDHYTSQYPFMRWLRHPNNRGVAAARNTGIRSAKGEIIAVLNADVLLPSDFFERVLKHYEKGADWVLVEARVLNRGTSLGRFAEAFHRYCYGLDDAILWSEAFTCRRSVAIRAGLFPENISGAGGEDVEFARRLLPKFKRVLDKSIVVDHVVPDSIRGFLKQKISRGRGNVWTFRYGRHHSLPSLLSRSLLKIPLATARDIGSFPRFFWSYLRSRSDPKRPWNDMIPFLGAMVLHSVGQRWGEWEALLGLMRRRPGPPKPISKHFSKGT